MGVSTLTVTVRAWYSHEQINLNTGKNMFTDSRWVLRLPLVANDAVCSPEILVSTYPIRQMVIPARWCHTLIMSAFAAPETANTQHSALLTTGKVSVILDGGGLGAFVMGATHTEVSSQMRCPGKREQVCPSGPIPSNNRWNLGSESGGKWTAIFFI